LLPAHALLQLTGGKPVIVVLVVDLAVLPQVLDGLRLDSFRKQQARLHFYHSLLWQTLDF
jgi:hypothetical protein